MSVNYKLLKNYSTSAKNAEYRAVIIENQKIGLRRIADDIEGTMSLTSADIVGAVAGLRNEIVHHLQSGNSVHLPGIGHFSLAVKGDVYEDPRTHHHRLRNAKVRTVKFRPDKEMMEALRYIEFVNTTYRVTAQLAKAGKLRNIGTGRTKLYARGEKRGESNIE